MEQKIIQWLYNVLPEQTMITDDSIIIPGCLSRIQLDEMIRIFDKYTTCDITIKAVNNRIEIEF